MNLRPVFACAALALGLASPALGQPTEAQMSALKSSCRSDYMAKCMSVKPGGPEAFQCLKKNEASLSAACRNAVNAVSAASAPAQQPKQAALAQPAAPAPAAPATASPAPASPPPAAAAPAAKPAAAPAPQHKPAAPPAAAAQPSAAQQNAIKQNCRNDFMSHCSGVQPGGAQALSCLQTNAARLSLACKSAVAIGGGAAAPKPAAAAPAAPAPAAMPAPKLNSPMEARIIREFCFTDFKVLCRGVRLGKGRALQCLAANAPALSPGCKAAMAQASR
ncbi:MAG: hypothetical protein RO009_21425 [Pseudorhodoplanes sp.]|jgi:hypothetical protein|nr:hypothetical protein [Pseudorhodoplanes sp.]